METKEVEANLLRTLTNAVQHAVSSGNRVVNMAALGMINDKGKELLIRITVVAEPPVFIKTDYPDPSSHEREEVGDMSHKIITTSVIEEMKMLEAQNDTSIRH